jgi:sulfate/thiosulfate transport system substrate-binding protein
VVANPKTAGVARWIFLALWGHKMRKGKGDAEPMAYVTRVFENVVVQPRDAREASDVFYKQKVADVLLTYENEVVLTNQVQPGISLSWPYVYVLPDSSMLGGPAFRFCLTTATVALHLSVVVACVHS